jgi:hypothetical protein
MCFWNQRIVLLPNFEIDGPAREEDKLKFKYLLPLDDEIDERIKQTSNAIPKRPTTRKERCA